MLGNLYQKTTSTKLPEEDVFLELHESANKLVQLYKQSDALPDWIHPLHIDENFRRTLDSLDDASQLLMQINSVIFSKIGLECSRATLGIQYSQRPQLTETVATVETLANRLRVDYVLSDLRLRLAHKLLDLLGYGLAFEFGSKTLYGATSKVDVTDDLATLRESIRRLSREVLTARRFEYSSVEAISTVRTRGSDGDYLATGWEPRHAHAQLTADGVIQVDMRKCSAWSSRPRLQRIGIQIDDRWRSSRTDYPPLQDGDGMVVRTDRFRGDRWSVSVIAAEVAMRAGDIQGGKEAPTPVWLSSTSLLNVDPRCEWVFQVESSCLQRSTKALRDLIVLFDCRVG